MSDDYNLDVVMLERLAMLVGVVREFQPPPHRDQLDAALRDRRRWDLEPFERDGEEWLRLFIDGRLVLEVAVGQLDPHDLLGRRS